MSVPAEPRRLINTRHFFTSFSTHQLDDAVQLLSPGVTYTVPGRSPFSGVFHGPDEVRGHLARFFEFSKSTYDVLKWVDWMVGQSHIAALQYAQAQSRGMVYRGHQLFLVETDERDDLCDIKLFFENLELANRFLSS